MFAFFLCNFNGSRFENSSIQNHLQKHSFCLNTEKSSENKMSFCTFSFTISNTSMSPPILHFLFSLKKVSSDCIQDQHQAIVQARLLNIYRICLFNLHTAPLWGVCPGWLPFGHNSSTNTNVSILGILLCFSSLRCFNQRL